MCALSLFLCGGELWTTSACVLLSMAVFMLPTGLNVTGYYWCAWRSVWLLRRGRADEDSDKGSIKRPIFSHVCQAGQGCCLFVGEVTRLLQCGHSNVKQSRLCPRVFGKDLLSFLVSQFVQTQVVPTGWPPCNRKHMKSILTSQMLLSL